MNSHWRIQQLANGLGEHAGAWDALNLRLFNGHPMLDSRYVDGLLRHFGTGAEYLCVREQDGVQMAMLVLSRRAAGIWGSFLPAQAQIGPVLMQMPMDMQDLMRHLPGFVAEIDILCNDPDYGDCSTSDRSMLDSTAHALTMNVSLKGSFEAYWGQRSKNLSKNLKRYERRLATDGIERSFICLTDPGEVSAGVARFAALESKGWKGRLGTAVSVDNTQGEFYSKLLSQFAASRQGRVYELWFDDKLAASRLVISAKGMVIILKTAFDESFDIYAPGRMLLRDVIEHLFIACPGASLEFYTHANPDQLSWAGGERWIRHVSFYRSPAIAKVFRGLRVVNQVLAAGRMHSRN
jgi:CelD/BcsL family acetyltransferase involved in cellulose biosynthesis